MKNHRLNSQRNSGIELLKLFGLAAIIINHIVQILETPNAAYATEGYFLDPTIATTNTQIILLAILRYGGSLGNSIFFICSAWFLLDKETSNKKKVLQMLMDIWVLSILFLIFVAIQRRGDIYPDWALTQFFPTTFETNWYMTCYVMICVIHPYLNWIIRKMDQRTLLRSVLIMSFIYFGINFIHYDHFFPSKIVIWVAIYFTVAYVKFYLPTLSNNVRFNTWLLIFSTLANLLLILATNFAGLRISFLSDKVLRWATNYNPFLLLMTISALNIARNAHFHSSLINKLSGLSMLVYLTHENMLVRMYYRPLPWIYVYNNYGYDHILLWAVLITIGTILISFAVSFLYQQTIQKLVARASDALYPRLEGTAEKVENYLMQFH